MAHEFKYNEIWSDDESIEEIESVHEPSIRQKANTIESSEKPEEEIGSASENEKIMGIPNEEKKLRRGRKKIIRNPYGRKG